MRCPFCNSEKTRVIDKRIAEDSTNRRRRECIACGKRFTTYERIEISEKTKNKVPYVKKRDGKVVEFEQEKITEAIFKAAESVGGHDRKIAEQLSEEVVKVINEKFDISNIPNVEEIQDIVEKVLIEKGHAKTAKAYILYRQKHTEIREIKNTMIDVNETIRGYLDRLDWRVRENSNEMFSFSGLLLYTAGKVMANYNLNEMYTPAISNAHVSGDLHIHDLSHGVIAYCCGHSLKNLLLMGFGGVPNKVECKPAKHLSTVVHQLVNYIGCLQMEFAGAQAFSSVDTLLAPFVREDNLDFKQVKQCMQQLIFSLNIPSRWGSQYPFSNLTFDMKCPQDLAEEKAVLGGKRMSYTYADCQKEMDMINKAFLEVMVEGDASGGVFTFPIPTYNLTKDFDWDGEIAKLLFEVAAKYGLPYFQNYIGSGLNSRSIRAMCLHPDEEILVKKDGKIQKTTMGNLVEMHADKFDAEGWSENNHDIKALALCGDNKFAWTQVKRFLRIKGRVLSEIKTKDGKSIKVSSDHLVPVMTESGIRVKRAGELSKKDYMLTARSALSALSSSYQKIGDYVFDEMFAKFAGFFVSEGNYLYDSRKPKSPDSLKGFQFTFNSNECSKIDEIKDIIKNKFGLLAKTKKDPRYSTIAVYLYNTLLAKSLYNAGLKKYNSVPPQLFASPKSVIEAFLEYVFKGDGYVKGKEIHLNDRMLSRELVLLYTLVGRQVTYRERKRSQVIRIQHNYGRGSRNRCIRDVLYDRVPLFMVDLPSVSGRRRANFRQAETIGNQLLIRFGGHCTETLSMLKNDIALVQIEDVAHTVMEKEQLFYDIELEENHLFVHSLGTVTHNCCRLNMDTSQLINRPGGMWSMGDSTGSIGVVTINMNRIGYEAKTKEEYFEKLRHRMLLAKDSLEIKRKVISKNLENGLMPYTKRYLGSFHNHFSTVGLVGMHESCLNFLKKGIDTEEGKQFTIEVLNFMREQLRQFQEETGSLYNLEATPAESTSYRLAMLDKKKYPDIITSGKKTPYLTNSTQLSVDYTEDIITALEHQKDIQPLYTGGTIFHTFLGERLSSGEACKRLVRKIAYNTRLPYFSITPTFSLCKSHGYLKGEQPICPECGAETEVYSRIVGYIRPIKNWNDGKQEEFKDRVVFAEKNLEKDFKTKIERALEKKEVVVEA